MAGKDRDEIAWLDIEVAGWPAGRAFDLKEFSIPGEIAESYRARWWWRSPAALGLVSLPLHLHKLGKQDSARSRFKPPERVDHWVDEHLTVHIDLS